VSQGRPLSLRLRGSFRKMRLRLTKCSVDVFAAATVTTTIMFWSSTLEYSRDDIWVLWNARSNFAFAPAAFHIRPSFCVSVNGSLRCIYFLLLPSLCYLSVCSETSVSTPFCVSVCEVVFVVDVGCGVSSDMWPCDLYGLWSQACVLQLMGRLMAVQVVAE
jgi:hypothetical protein